MQITKPRGPAYAYFFAKLVLITQQNFGFTKEDKKKPRSQTDNPFGLLSFLLLRRGSEARVAATPPAWKYTLRVPLNLYLSTVCPTPSYTLRCHSRPSQNRNREGGRVQLTKARNALTGEWAAAFILSLAAATFCCFRAASPFSVI